MDKYFINKLISIGFGDNANIIKFFKGLPENDIIKDDDPRVHKLYIYKKILNLELELGLDAKQAQKVL